MARILAANLLFLLMGLGPLGLAGEAWLRRSAPFEGNRTLSRFVPGVGALLEPNEEVRWTNRRDFWTISRTNRLGFLDREPAPPRAAENCRIALIGDSLVAARQVEVREKVQVALEALAARERPELDLTASAFGRAGVGQVQQIPIYDAFVRPLRPKVVVLVGHRNDFWDNSPVLNEVEKGARWAALYARAERGAGGRVRLRLPEESSPVVREWVRASRRSQSGWRAWRRDDSFLWRRLRRFRRRWRKPRVRVQRDAWRRLSGEAALLAGWRSPPVPEYGSLLGWRPEGAFPSAPIYAEAIEMTAFALDEFARRAARDGSRLVLLLDYGFGASRAPMRDLAEERGIPIVDLREHLTSVARGNLDDARFPGDNHWTPKGHRWAAEALWKHLKEHPSLCDPTETGGA